MREKKKSNEHSQQILSDKETEVIRQAVEIEYTTLFRQVHKTTQNTARHILQHVVQHKPPRALSMPIPISTLESNADNSEDTINTVSVSISDGVNKKSQTKSTVVTMMPTLPRVRELISYVPTTKNVATRGHLIGIPYLGDKFDDEDQQLIDSISIEPSKQRKSMRKKKLDDQSLEKLFESIRLNKAWNSYSNDQIIDAILHYHRDSTPRARLVAFATQNSYCVTEADRHAANVDTCDNVDADLDDLVIKPWCSRFCPRCYTYNCLLHKDKTQILPLPKQIFISSDANSCDSSCYKNQREHLKRPLSPSRNSSSESHGQRHSISIPDSSEQVETVKKRRRKSTPIRIVNSTSALVYQHKHNENVRINETITADIYLDENNYTLQKKMSPHLLTRIENRMKNQFVQHTSISSLTLEQQIWTLTNRSLFRLLYFLVEGDLCLLSQLFDGNQTCYDIYQQFISDAKYFAERTTKEIRASSALFSIRRPYRRRMPEGSTRVFLNYMKKYFTDRTKEKTTDGTSPTLKPAYEPCSHEGPCAPGNSHCRCAQMGTFCEKYCNCSVDCPHRFPGCACKASCLANNCLCVAQGRECDPDLCHKCGATQFVHSIDQLQSMVKSETEVDSVIMERKSMPSTRTIRSQMLRKTAIPQRQHSLRTCRAAVEPSYRGRPPREKRPTHARPSSISDASQVFPTITCANIALQRKIHKQILVAESDVAGYGAFLGSTSAQPGDLIAEYTGEIISEAEADRRGRLYDKQACSYLFNLDMQHCIDARQFGNKLRFANHSSRPNCVPKIKLVNGDYRIGIYAKQIINQGEELFFEYMYDAHQRQQYVNNERIDDEEQDGLIILARFIDNAMLVRPSID